MGENILDDGMQGHSASIIPLILSPLLSRSTPVICQKRARGACSILAKFTPTKLAGKGFPVLFFTISLFVKQYLT